MRMWNGLIDTAAIRSATAVAAAATLLAAGGCRNHAQETARAEHPPDERTLNTLMVKASIDENERNAIVADRTIYTRAFEPASAELTELGLRQVRVLADAYGQQTVRLNVARGDAANDLYERRLESVRAAFAHRGVDPARLTFADGLPGGPGRSSEHVWQAYLADPTGEGTQGMWSSGTGTGQQGSGMPGKG